MRGIQSMIERRSAEILERWAQGAAHAASARGLSRPELLNIMPRYLGSLAASDGPELGKRQMELVESHVSSRLRHGFELPELQQEFALLGRCIFAEWASIPAQERPEAFELEQMLEVVHASAVLLSDMFVRHLLDDAQSEKKFFRLIRQAFMAGPTSDGKTLPDRLQAAMPLVMEALDAATAALLLYDPESEELVMTASAGLADERVARYARALGTHSFAGQIAEREEPTVVLDAETTSLDVTDTLRHSGIHSLLGVRIPISRELVGVMYIGLCEQRPFSARERRRMESIAEHLALLIENVRMTLLIEKRVEELRAEQTIRKGLAAVLAHDIRGPLAAARAAAQMLLRSKDAAKIEHWTGSILRSVDRGERMVSDLLDVECVHAGQMLSFSREPVDLGALACDVVAELSLEQGENRLVVSAPEAPVVGNWGREELRRAIWNLSTNALKYGSPGSLVRIEVRAKPDLVELEVHNEGPPIPPEKQPTLFLPFFRAQGESSAPGGWGIGLSVVRGVAEAHGGSVVVDSAAGRGTSFTMRIPRG